MVVRSLIVVLTVVATAVTAASANTPPSTKFSAVLRATLEQRASYQAQAPSGDCAYVYTGGWTNELEIHSARPTIMGSKIVARAPSKLRPITLRRVSLDSSTTLSSSVSM